MPCANSMPITAGMISSENTSNTPAIATERGLRRSFGALIFNVSNAIADQTGLAKGDVILQINGSPVRSAQDASKLIDLYGGRTYLRLVVERQGQLYMTEFAVR